jgi:DNA-binding transcriptional LysR family regulator
MTVQIRLFDSFVAVAKERHFGRAAERLNVAQPHLSRDIRRLETELGVELFDRKSRPIRLTPAGVDFLEEAQAALHQVHRALASARLAGSTEHGHVSVGAFPWAYNLFLPSLLRLFQGRLPDVTLRLATISAGELPTALSQERLDVGLATVESWLSEDRALTVEPLLAEPWVAVLPHDHSLAERTELSLDDLVDLPFVSPRGSVDRETELFAGRGLSRIVAQIVPIFHAQFSLVAAGTGIGIQFASFSQFACPGLSFVPVSDAPPVQRALVWRRDDEREPLRTFLDAARQAAQRLKLEAPK